MVPYSYNMVDMGGIDLAEANGTEVPGAYEKIQDAMDACGVVILYNWKFCEIEIAPSYYDILQMEGYVLINGMIQLTELDVITVLGIDPPVVPISPISITENGEYRATPPASGFNPVVVNVQPNLISGRFTSNGTYIPESPYVGFSEAIVDIPAPSQEVILSGTSEPSSSIGENQDIYVQYEELSLEVYDYRYNIVKIYRKLFGEWVDYQEGEYLDRATRVWTQNTGSNNASLYVQEGRYINGQFVPSGEAATVVYRDVQSPNHTDFREVSITYYSSNWHIVALEDVYYNSTLIETGNDVTSWRYNTTADILITHQQIT